MADDFGMGYALGQDSNSGNSGGGFFGGEGIWAILLFAMIFGYGNGGFGGFGGAGANGALTRAELYDGFAIQNIDAAVRGVQNGISDSTYALTGAVTNGFHGVDNAICNAGYQTQQGFNGVERSIATAGYQTQQGFNGVEQSLANMGYQTQAAINGVGHQISDCCCQTGRAIDGVNYNMATQFNTLGNTIQSGLRDVIDATNANYRGLMDFMVAEKMASKDARIAELSNQVSQSNQTAAFRAAIDASTAEIIRRTGHECPSPAYWVSPPTPVQVPYNSGCGCGCGC